jgi:hypothetical protein
MSTSRVVMAVWLVACGNVEGGGGADGPRPVDAAPPPCPGGTIAIAGTNACIEAIERGTAEWTAARDTCLGEGRRLCSDAEWVAACESTSGLENMIGDDGGTDLQWEWVADEFDGEAHRRGYEICADESVTSVFDPHDYRCCVDR